MEEDEYKSTYDEIAANRCAFEKALTNNLCRCRFSRHFWLADREGYACKDSENAAKCRYFLENLRENSRFSLKLPAVGSQLPHNMEIRVQVGGMRGMRSVLCDEQGDHLVEDIKQLIEQAEADFGNLDALPYSEVVKSVASFQGRSRRKKSRGKE